MYSQHGPGAGTPKATPWARRWALTVVQRPRSRRPRRRAGRSAEASGPGTPWAGRRYCCREAVCLLLDSVRARGPRWHSQRPAVCRRAPDTPRGLCGARPEPARQGPAEQVGAPGPGAADGRCLGAPLPPPPRPPVENRPDTRYFQAKLCSAMRPRSKRPGFPELTCQTPAWAQSPGQRWPLTGSAGARGRSPP